jgi:hypothetical protein
MPAMAQMEVVCDDYLAMDNAAQMAAIAELESMTGEMASQQDLTAEGIHEKLAADCAARPDALIVDVIKE